MKAGDRVREGDRRGRLVEVYEMRSWNGVPLGRKSAVVHFDGDTIPTSGVWLDALRAEGGAR